MRAKNDGSLESDNNTLKETAMTGWDIGNIELTEQINDFNFI
jgi:hypothetical protein